MVKKVMKMADKAVNECAAAKDAGPQESLPYDKKYYGELKSIDEFNTSHKITTVQVLKRAGGKFSTMRATDNAFWKPKSKIFSKDFIKRFPKFV